MNQAESLELRSMFKKKHNPCKETHNAYQKGRSETECGQIHNNNITLTKKVLFVLVGGRKGLEEGD